LKSEALSCLRFPSLVVKLGLESELETRTEGVESRIIRAILAKKPVV